MQRTYDCKMHYYGDEFDEGYTEWLETPEGTSPFYVRNLDDSPEDAIVGRELFDCSDYIKALNDGIALGRAGYTSARIAQTVREDNNI